MSLTPHLLNTLSDKFIAPTVFVTHETISVFLKMFPQEAHNLFDVSGV